MKLTKILSTAIVAITFGMLAQSAQAAPIIVLGAGSGLTTFDQFINFEQNLATNTVITNQFSGSGITFSALGNGAVRFDSCGNNAWNSGSLSGHTINTYGPSCLTNGIDDSFSLKFNAAVQAVSFGNYLYGGQFSNALIQAVLNGNVVATLGYNFQGFDFTIIYGGVFDELRFIEGTGAQAYLVMDNLAFQYAPVSGVPAPGALALLGLGLLGVGGIRRNRKAA